MTDPLVPTFYVINYPIVGHSSMALLPLLESGVLAPVTVSAGIHDPDGQLTAVVIKVPVEVGEGTE